VSIFRPPSTPFTYRATIAHSCSKAGKKSQLTPQEFLNTIESKVDQEKRKGTSKRTQKEERNTQNFLKALQVHLKID
jgi:hypothetical protein